MERTMNRSLERHIKHLAKRIFNQARREFPGAEVTSCRYNGQYAEIKIAPNLFLAFQHWAEDGQKPLFMIIWRGSKYLMEFDLSRVIFSNDDKLTWILNIPTRKENRQNLSELGYHVQKIDPVTVQIIHQQMTACNGRARRTPKGYILAKEENVDEAISRFLNIVSNLVKSDQQRNIMKGQDAGDEDIRVFEGQIAESKILGRKRNRGIVEQRKVRDQFTCQACRFSAYVNGRYVIECHHKYPLRGERITDIDDLVCLCPTCHRIAHRRDIPFSVKEIARILQRS
ncbi:MAG: HNH endonuclease [Syntrophaceae bacterium]